MRKRTIGQVAQAEEMSKSLEQRSTLGGILFPCKRLIEERTQGRNACSNDDSVLITISSSLEDRDLDSGNKAGLTRSLRRYDVANSTN